MRSRISSRASGCSASGTPSAAAAHWRVWSSGVAPMPPQENTDVAAGEGVAQVGGDALAVVAHVACPGQRQSRAPPAARSPWAGACPARLPERISSPMMMQAEVHAAACAPGGPTGCEWRSGSAAAGQAGGRRLSASRSALQRGEQVVREPERREREHQRVEPDRRPASAPARTPASARSSPTAGTAPRRGSRCTTPMPSSGQRCAAHQLAALVARWRARPARRRLITR